jgi:hypothetical protein
MRTRVGPLDVLILTGLAVASSLTACGGRSVTYVGGSDTGVQGAGGNSGASSSSGGRTGCEYNGTHYELGETFGECNECSCTKDGGVTCGAMDCAMGTGGVSGTAGVPGRGGTPWTGGAPTRGAGGTPPGGRRGGSGGIGGTGGIELTGVAPGPGCDYNGTHYPTGADWLKDCNLCTCGTDSYSCTSNPCSTGGSYGNGTDRGTGGTEAGADDTGAAGISTGGFSTGGVGRAGSR